MTSSDGGTRVQRLPYWPALDGLRALAVVAVLGFHSGIMKAQGGFLGVSLFFTLSGFLITSLVLSERRDTGGVGITAFWVRRVRRLLPAALVTLVLAIVVTMTAVPVAQRTVALGDIRAALFNLANWRFIFQGAQYADAGVTPSPVQHFWSLAIEEQFYLVFPVLAAVALRRRTGVLTAVLAAIALGSLGLQLLLSDPNRVYFGTDTRAAELAVGGLLAIAMPHLARSSIASRLRLFDVAGGIALLMTLLLWVGVNQQAAGLYDGGLLVVAVVSSLVVLGAVQGRLLPRLLGLKPLVALGKISYGVYLYHFPLFIVLSAERTGLPRRPLFLTRFGATVALATVSYFLLERPIRRGVALPGRRVAVALAGTMAVVLLATIPAQNRAHDQMLAAHIDPLAPDIAISPSAPVSPQASPATTSTTVDPAPPTSAGDPEVVGVTTTVPAAGGSGVPATTIPVQVRPPRIVVVGDSTAEANGSALRDWGISSGRLEVSTVTSPGCAVHHGPRFRVRLGYDFRPEGCDQLLPAAVREADRIEADAIVVFIGSSQLADWEIKGESGWQHVGETRFDSGYRTALDAATAELSEAGVPVLWADVPTPTWDLATFGKMVGFVPPGAGPVTLNEPGRADRLNQIDSAELEGLPLVERWDFAGGLEGPDGTISTASRPDGLHMAPEAIAAAADAWLFDALDVAYSTVLERMGEPEPGDVISEWALS